MNSGTRRYEPVSGVEGVSSGGNATAKMPDNRRHLIAKIFASATIGGILVTDPTLIIASIVQQVKGKTIREDLPVDLVADRAMNGLPVDPSGALSLFYAEPARAAVMDELVPAWDTFGGVHDFTLKMRLLPGLVNPSIDVLDVYDGSVMTGANGAKVRQIIKHTPYTYNFGTQGDITNLPVDLPITRLILKGAAQPINAVKVIVNDTETVYEKTRAQMLSTMSDYGLNGAAYGANAFPVCFDLEQQLFKRLEGIRSLTVKVTSAAPQQVDAILHQVAPDYF